MEPVVRLDHVTKRFGSQVALADVSLEVPRGAVFALLGENGAGKTTAIRIMLGLAQPNSGHAEVLGLPSAKRGLEIRRSVGYVPERPTLYDWMTVRQIGWFAAGFYADGYLTRYLQLADRFSLPRKRKLKALSKGMRAKVSLSLGLALDPDLLVLDEPTSGLDTLVRREFLESMVDRAAGGRTVFLSSHQIVEVERVADIVAIVRKGELLLVERLDDLKASIREVTVTFADEITEKVPPIEPSANGTLLAQRWKGRQWCSLIRGMHAGSAEKLKSKAGVQAVEVRAPALEEIFVAYMQGRPGEVPARPEP